MLKSIDIWKALSGGRAEIENINNMALWPLTFAILTFWPWSTFSYTTCRLKLEYLHFNLGDLDLGPMTYDLWSSLCVQNFRSVALTGTPNTIDKLHINKPGFVTSLNYTTQVLHHQKKNVILRTTYPCPFPIGKIPIYQLLF